MWLTTRLIVFVAILLIALIVAVGVRQTILSLSPVLQRGYIDDSVVLPGGCNHQLPFLLPMHAIRAFTLAIDLTRSSSTSNTCSVLHVMLNSLDGKLFYGEVRRLMSLVNNQDASAPEKLFMVFLNNVVIIQGVELASWDNGIILVRMIAPAEAPALPVPVSGGASACSLRFSPDADGRIGSAHCFIYIS